MSVCSNVRSVKSHVRGGGSLRHTWTRIGKSTANTVTGAVMHALFLVHWGDTMTSHWRKAIRWWYSWVNENWAFSRRESCNSRLFECKSRIIFFWELFILSQLLRELHNSQTSSRITKFSPTSPTSRMTFLIIFENYLILNNFENDFSHHIRELPTSQQLREWLFSSYARNVSSNCLPQTRHNHIGCIYLIFLHCVFSNVSSNHLHEMRHNHIGCICLTFPQCAFSNVSLKRLHKRM